MTMLCVAIIHTGGPYDLYYVLPLYILVAHITMLCVVIIHTGGPLDLCCVNS